jgi:fumarate hydratase subunit alpha
MRSVSTERISYEVQKLFLSTAFELGTKIQNDLKEAINLEGSSLGRSVLNILVKNNLTAAEKRLPLCQDTGLPQIIIELGQEVSLDGPPLEQAIIDGTRRAYVEGNLRRSACHPITRQNIGEHIPISLETKIVPGDRLTIFTLAKGGGCDNMSLQKNIRPTSSPKEIKDTLIEMVLAAGPDACPPFYLGLSIGGSFESAPRLARTALLALLFGPPMTHEEEDLATEIKNSLNNSGLGPMALGGKTTILDLGLKIHPTHIASLPLALNLNCHSFRAGRIDI